jgi:hypothetical protein
MNSRQPVWITAVLLIVGSVTLITGLQMLFAPAYWYAHVPGVPETGPLNAHLVADGGTFNIPIGLGLLWAARNAQRQVLLIAVAACAGLLHSLLHVWSHAEGLLSAEHLTTEVLGIYIPAAALIAIAAVLWRQAPQAASPGVARSPSQA